MKKKFEKHSRRIVNWVKIRLLRSRKKTGKIFFHFKILFSQKSR